MSPSKIDLHCSKSIFVKVDQPMIPLDAVYCDKDGIFVYAYQLGSLIECSTCRRYYDPEKQRPSGFESIKTQNFSLSLFQR